MSDDGISIPLSLPDGCRRRLDRVDLNNSGSIDSQEEMNMASAAVYYFCDPREQLYFHLVFTKMAEKRGWTIHRQFQSAFEWLENISKNGHEKPMEKIGYAYLATPFYTDVETVVQRYFPCGGYAASADGNSRSILNKEGEEILTFYNDEQCGVQDYPYFLPTYITKIHSPLTRKELSKELLWFSNSFQIQLSYLLGLPMPTYDEIRDYIYERFDCHAHVNMTVNAHAKMTVGWFVTP